MTKLFCDMCKSEIEPNAVRELDAEWAIRYSPTGWKHYEGDLCEKCFYEREELHAKLDALLTNESGGDDVKATVKKALEGVDVYPPVFSKRVVED